VYSWRARLGACVRHERALIAGCLALAAGFVLSLPLIASRVALAVQLQTSRVLWIVEAVATLYVVWVLSHAPWRRSDAPQRRGDAARWRAVVLAGVLGLASAGRAIYAVTLEQPERRYVSIDLPQNPWTQTLEWIRQSTALDAHLLADPGHAWKFGASARIVAVRDVYLEEVKDVAMALYSPETASRVRSRIAAVGSFDTLDRARLELLRRRFDLDYLICENGQADLLGLPVVWRNQRFSVVTLAPIPTPR
jgi:hypothetical protein